MNYLFAATLLLIVAICLGFYLVFVGIRQRKRLPAIGLTHAGLAITGFIALGLQIATGVSDKLNNLAAFLLVIAIIGGVMVFALHEKNSPPSMPIVTLHAIMGLVAVILLVFNVINT